MFESSRPFKKPSVGERFIPHDAFHGIKYKSRLFPFQIFISFFSEECGGNFPVYQPILDRLSDGAKDELERLVTEYYLSVRESLTVQPEEEPCLPERTQTKRPRRAITNALRMEVFARDNFTCRYCGRKPPDVQLQPDHVHPVAKGGSGDIENLVTACKECNTGKGAKTLTELEGVAS